MPQTFTDLGACVDAVLARVGPRVVLGLPLGIGKPNLFANEFFARARRDPAIDLTIVTALSLAKPRGRSDLERRLLGPMVERIFGDWPELAYVEALRQGALPPNVRVIEFYLEPGAWLGVEPMQQQYLSANYTHVARDLLARGVNVIAHAVARRTAQGDTQFSLGSNPDVTVDLLPHLDAARAAGRDIVMVAAVHPRMPFTFGGAEIAPERFDFVLDDPQHDYTLYAPPNLPLRTVDHAIAMHVSGLVRDGGTLQIGIGELGDGLVYALLLRHQQNDTWRRALAALGGAVPGDARDAGVFCDGLYACTEMFLDQMLDLVRAGVMRRRVYASLPLMRLLAAGRIEERFDAGILPALADAGVGPRLSAAEFDELRRCGVFRSDVAYRDGRVRARDGEWIAADLDDTAACRAIAAQCLGRELQGGLIAHAAFFLGPRGFYAKLREMPERELRQIDFTGVGFVNQIDGPDAELRRLQRRDARFVNTTMMVTLLGAAVSDALADGRVVSGVGGQYNFVAMAHALPDARSILCVRATREKDGRVTSNLVWNYGHTTIPRHLRDIVVSEYGVADLRGATDSEVITRLLAIADSRFQPELLAAARAAGKLAASYTLPDAQRANFPERTAGALAPFLAEGLYSAYPFGTDLTDEEIVLAAALKGLAADTLTTGARLRTLLRAWLAAPTPDMEPYLARMGLATPRNPGERTARRLVALALRRVPPGANPA
jgi:acyl-CoA hydrolase